jgi:hypothetical protein
MSINQVVNHYWKFRQNPTSDSGETLPVIPLECLPVIPLECLPLIP